MTDHHDHFGSHNYIPPEVQADISAGKALFEEALEEGPRDENHERLLASLEDVIVKLDEEKKAADGYIFNVEEFVDACQHVVSDQLSALKGEKIDRVEFAKRFNRWFVFCDAVVNMGISCRYPKDALKDKEYEEVFKTLKLNKQFEATFLKPRRIRVEMRHKSKQVMDKYPWLAMPVLIVRDKDDVEHEIALTPSPNATVWWLDILSSFHGSYNWVLAPQFGEGDDDEEEAPVTSIDQPYPEGTIREGAPYKVHRNDDLNELLKKATAAAQEGGWANVAPLDGEARVTLDYVREEPTPPKRSWLSRLWSKLCSWIPG